MTHSPKIRTSDSEGKLSKEEFLQRYQQLFSDPWFEPHQEQINVFSEIAWKANQEGRKAPRTQKAGPGYDDPSYDLSLEWVKTKKQMDEAQKIHDDQKAKRQILLIHASHRNDHTCPGEISKSSRLFDIAR